MAKDDRVYHTEIATNPRLEVRPKAKQNEGRTSEKRGNPGEKRPTISRELILRLVTWLEKME